MSAGHHDRFRGTVRPMMNFGQALEALKLGHRVARTGWNDKGMWIALTPGSVVDTSNTPIRGALAIYVAQPAPVPVHVTIGAHIDMRAADGSLVVGWLASQTDMLADDWVDLDAAQEKPGEGGRAAYERYLFVSDGKSLVSGAELPGFDGLSEPIRAAWRAAADPTAPRFRR